MEPSGFEAVLRERALGSLARSRKRREWARRLRRRRFRARGGALSLAAIGLTLVVAGAGIAVGQSGDVELRKGDSGAAVKSLQRKLRITVDGEFGPQTERALKAFERRRGLRADGVADRRTLQVLGLTAGPSGRADAGSAGGAPAGQLPPEQGGQAPPVKSPVPPELERVAQCESGGDPRRVSRDGQYRGKYQFLRSTWRNLGGRGDPAMAPEWLQDRLALKLYRRSGTAPWGACA